MSAKGIPKGDGTGKGTRANEGRGGCIPTRTIPNRSAKPFYPKNR